MTRTADNEAALARAEAVLDLHPDSDCALVEVLADLEMWAEEHGLDWNCVLDAGEQQYLATR